MTMKASPINWIASGSTLNRMQALRGYLKRKLSVGLIALLAAAMLGTATRPAGANVNASDRTTSLATDKRIMHLLNRIGYGPRPGDIEAVRRMGIDRYIDLQLHPDRINDTSLESKLSSLETLHMPIAQLYDKYPQPGLIARDLGIKGPGAANAQKTPQPAGQPQGQVGANNPSGTQPNDADAQQQQQENRQMIQQYYARHGLKQPQEMLTELQAQKLIRAVDSQRQLDEVLTDFWFNHFNIFWPKGQDRWMTTDFEMNAIRPHVLGKFKDLLMATAKSPAMLFYLDNAESSAPGAMPPRPFNRPGFNRGPFGRPPFGPATMPPPGQQPNPNAPNAANQKKKRKSGINENYARELMELHTMGVEGGYTQKDVQEVARCLTGWTIEGPKRGGHFVFRDWMHDNGEKTVLGHKIAAGGGQRDGEIVIDILVHHPSTVKFISTALVRRFVSDTPPQPLVDRVSQVYVKTDGDIREMMKTVLTSPEFNSPAAYRGKIKSPFELAASAIRALGGDTNGSPALGQFVAKMGEPLYRYQAPTGYPDRAEQWVNTGSLLQRLNFGLAVSSNKIPGTTVAIGNSEAGSGQQLIDRAISELLGGDVSDQTRTVLYKQMKEGLPVKGELMDDGSDKTSAMAGDGSDTMATTAGGVNKQDRRDMRAERKWQLQASAQPPQPIDAETAKAFGLVLGSPEFQRR
jgi:uncharacterized protein (DUF1800 family)